jgi:hypothetical protein
MDSEGFPGGRYEYWKRHPGEQAQLYHWIEGQPDGSINQLVTTEETTMIRKKAIAHTSSYHVKGNKKGGRLAGFSVEFLGAAPVVQQPSAGYAEKDFADLKLEEAQTVRDEKKKDKLGAVRGLSGLPADEVPSCKYAIWQYFQAGTRNAEVDAVVPIGNTGRSVLYTLRFRAGNDVEIERVGPRGVAAGERNIGKLDIRSVRGYVANATEPLALLRWLKQRYKAATPTGTTVQEIGDAMNAKLMKEAGNQEWFSGNYDIHVLPASEGQVRLESEHQVPASLTADVTNFTPAELRVIEGMLQSVSDQLLRRLTGTRLVRKGAGFDFDQKTNSYVATETLSGITLSNSGRTIVIFDSAMKSEEILFVGGREGTRPFSATVVAHEFGHVIEAQEGIKKAFYETFVKKGVPVLKAAPPTKYATRLPKKELFTEMFALYQTDPEWLRSSRPDVFAWFEILSSTGKPPPQKR